MSSSVVLPQGYSGARPTAIYSRDPIVCISNWVPHVSTSLCGGAVVKSPMATPAERLATRVVFTTHTFTCGGRLDPLPTCRHRRAVVTSLGRLELRMFASEARMLRAWQQFVVTEVDPDVICGFDAAGCVGGRRRVCDSPATHAAVQC